MPETLNKTHIAFRRSVEKLCESVLQVIESELDSSTKENHIRNLSKQAQVWSFNHPSDLGGPATRSLLELVIIHDTLASHNIVQVPGVFGPTPGLLGNASEPLRSSHLKPFLQGTKRAAFGFTEPVDAKQPTRATVENGSLIVNGQKSYVTGGQSADFINTLVEVENFGPSVVVIDRQCDGVTVERVFPSSDGSTHASIVFRDVKVPMTNIVGKPGRGLPRAMDQITDTRLVLSAQSAGLARWVIGQVSAHIRAPHRSGQPLASREGVRIRYADMRIKAFAMRSMVYRTARIADSGENSVNETIASKVFCTEGIGEIVDTAIQLTGGAALRVGHPLEKLQRLVRSWRLAEGASDILRLSLARGDLELNKGKL